MSLLFSPLKVRGTEFANRLWVSPMCQYSAEDGLPNDWHHVHLAQFASGGAGLVMTEATAVVPEGRITPRDTGLWNEAQREAWRPIVSSIHARGAQAGIQLSHAGRKGAAWWPFSGQHGTVPAEVGGWTSLAPSAEAFDGFAVPAELTGEQIAALPTRFAEATVMAAEAGFDVVEIHAAHGYLLHEFLSPLSNHREDRWGGDLTGRSTLLLDVIRAVRAAAGDELPLFVRFSATDSAPGGLQVEDVAQVAVWAKEAGADFFDVSSSGLVKHQKIEVFPGYQVPFAAYVRRATEAPTGTVGMITSGIQAEQILQSGDADAILAGREFLRDPHFATRAARELSEPVATMVPAQYQRAHPA